VGASVQLLHTGGGSVALNNMIMRDADFAVAGMPAAMSLRANGGDVVCLAPGSSARHVASMRWTRPCAMPRARRAPGAQWNGDCARPVQAARAIAILAGFSTLLLEGYGDRIDATGSDYLNRIQAGAARMSERMDNLLDLSRLSRQELACGDVDLGAMAAEIVAELRASAPERNVEVVIAADMVAFADPDTLDSDRRWQSLRGRTTFSRRRSIPVSTPVRSAPGWSAG